MGKGQRGEEGRKERKEGKRWLGRFELGCRRGAIGRGATGCQVGECQLKGYGRLVRAGARQGPRDPARVGGLGRSIGNIGSYDDRSAEVVHARAHLPFICTQMNCKCNVHAHAPAHVTCSTCSCNKVRVRRCTVLRESTSRRLVGLRIGIGRARRVAESMPVFSRSPFFPRVLPNGYPGRSCGKRARGTGGDRDRQYGVEVAALSARPPSA